MFKTRSISQLEKSLARTLAGLQEQNELLSWLSGYVEESNEFKEFNNSAIIDQEVKYENRLNHLQDQYDLLEIEKDCDVWNLNFQNAAFKMMPNKIVKELNS